MRRKKILSAPDEEVVGIFEEFTREMYDRQDSRDQVYPVDTISHRRGDYCLTLTFVPFDRGRKPLNGGRYEIFLINSKLGLKEGSDLSFGGVPVYRQGDQETAKLSGRRLLDRGVSILENYLAGKTDIQSHHDLFLALKMYLADRGDFELVTSNNPEPYR